MEVQERWNVAYVGHVVTNNGVKIAFSIKRDTSEFEEL